MNRLDILRRAKKKRSLTVRDFWYHTLEELVHLGLLHKTFPKGRKIRAPGWPVYILSKRGRIALVKDSKAQERINRNEQRKFNTNDS